MIWLVLVNIERMWDKTKPKLQWFKLNRTLTAVSCQFESLAAEDYIAVVIVSALLIDVVNVTFMPIKHSDWWGVEWK